MNRTQDARLPDAGPVDKRVETATFAMGCFWGPDGLFGVIPGVIRTRVGYAGGASATPTYHDLDGHAEAIQIDFDPSIVSYDQLLSAFWENHDGFAAPYSRQYRSVVFAHNEAQRAAAEKLVRQASERRGAQAQTEIADFQQFTRAEDYHQKYRLQASASLRPISDELKSRLATFADYVDSTIVARINGYVSGWSTREHLESEIAMFGLSESSQALLRSRVPAGRE
ncbi:peptide-methionine (S)-S-oxide reductase MsrA [Candidatus Bipolaricaulota bacterium]|nr:peptide-methionine (S)-S-oxide reductase MsrA [Candidatus Bipolaricaulota bacterium]